MASRAIQAFLLAILITLGLIFTMHALIKMAQPELNKRESFKLPDFVHVPPPESLQTITPKPNRPDDVLEQPDVPEQDIQPQKVDINSKIGVGQIKLGINKDLNKDFNSADGEYLPIFKAPPIYPKRAASRGLCGWVILEFVVTTSGGVRDPVVIESSSSIFESSAKKAAKKFKYKPRQVGGKPVEVSGVQNKITFQMEGGC